MNSGGPVRARPDGYVKTLVTRALWALGGAVFLSLVLVKALASAQISAPFPMVVVLMVIVAVPFVIARQIEEQPVPATVLADPHTDRSFPEADDAVRVAVARWDLRLEAQTDDRRTALALIELASDRLRLVHGVDPIVDPERVRALVGPHLWQLFSDGPRSLSPTAMARVITEMEAL